MVLLEIPVSSDNSSKLNFFLVSINSDIFVSSNFGIYCTSIYDTITVIKLKPQKKEDGFESSSQ